MAIWHIFSDGTRADIPFNTDEDKIFAWNSIAICAVSTNVRIWVATVNDTHLHLLAEGSAENIENFRNLLHPRLQKHSTESSRESTPGVAEISIFQKKNISLSDVGSTRFR